MKPLHRLTSALRDLFFPPRCMGCDELLPPFQADTPVLCPLCRTAWESAVVEEAAMTDHHVYLTAYRSGQTDGVPERVIYHIKHKGDPRVFGFVAARIAPRVLRISEGESLLFTYPPRRRAAIRRDGFDQAKKLSEALAKACGGKSVSLLRRTLLSTDEQKTLDAAERQDSASTAYTLKGSAHKAVSGRTVVLCDDLCTTGATLISCAELLYRAGARRVIFATVSRTAERGT